MDELLIIVKKANEAVKSDRIRRIALSSTLAIQKGRIFEKGLNETGGQIGKYSTKPISIAKNRQARNTGKTYFKGGYNEYKSAVGKNPGYINFRDTDQMMNDYGLSGGGDSYAYGFQNGTNGAKAGFLQDRFGTVFHVSEKELDQFGDVLLAEINKVI